jgi:predicted regulator of Ras-like GTPase activity (Roadblock/LC7/MglB family)
MSPIDAVLSRFLDDSGALGAFLVGRDGHFQSRVGTISGFDEKSIAVLVSGSFAATQQMAKLLGDEEFSAMFHQEDKKNIQLSLVGASRVLAVVFDERTTLGRVRFEAAKATRELARHLGEDGPDPSGRPARLR